MTSGRKPKPTHLKLLAGKPGHRALNEDEPQPDVLDGDPEPPAHLGERAREEWKRTYPVLLRNRLITEADVTAFAAYCQAYGRWQEAEEKIATTPLVAKTATGYPIQNPYLAIANKALEQMHKFMTEFGMTPSSRSRVQVSGAGRGAASNPFRRLGSGKAPAGKRSA